MKISYKWLQELLGFDIDDPRFSPLALAEMLTMSGSSVESIEPKGQELSGITTARVLEVESVPGSDKLTLCRVDSGNGILEMICGAPNVRKGLNVLVAPPGAIISGGQRIEKAIIQGIESLGMILAEDELGISDRHEEIIELDPDQKPGVSLQKLIDLTDTVFDLEITPNRPDCLSHIGIARELKALTGLAIKYPSPNLNEADPSTANLLSVEIADPDACPRYTARLVTNVKVEQSPLWFKARLHYLGIRPINNVVDITNYVLLETGHPLHAFDFDYFADKKIVIRKAAKGERFVTLDDIERELLSEHLLITDGNTPVALAGIMGGANSEVNSNTESVLIESAYFDPVTIRRGSKALGLSTESSQRFERGADIEMAPKANDRAASLIQQFCGGVVLRGIIDICPRPFKSATIRFRPQRVSEVLGVNVELNTIKSILDGLDIKYSDGNELRIEQPSFRPDLTREIDIIEEIARIYGLDKIPESFRAGGRLPIRAAGNRLELTDRLRTFLVGRGFVEIFPLTLIDGNELMKLFPAVRLVRLKNPLSEELSTLRPDLICSMIKTLRHNINHGNRDLRLFEIGPVFVPSPNGPPKEPWRLCLGVSGLQKPMSWRHQPGMTDFYTISGELELLAGHLDFDQFIYKPYPDQYFNDECSFEIWYNNICVGRAGVLSQKVARQFGIKQECYIAELDLDLQLSFLGSLRHYRPLPKFPGTDRDIALVMDSEIQAGKVMDVILKTGGRLIEEVFPFDLYRQKNIGQNKKSLAFRIKFRSPEKTLTDEEVDIEVDKIVKILYQEFGATLRA